MLARTFASFLRSSPRTSCSRPLHHEMWSSSNSSTTDNANHDPKNPPQNLDATNWRSYIQPQVILPTLVLTGATLGSVSIYRHYLRRISTVASIPPGLLRKGSLFGRVTSVGDGDGFRLYHTPGGRLAGWGWLRSVPRKREELVNQTVSLFTHCLSELYPSRS